MATTAVVCVVCSFTAGLLLGFLLNQYMQSRKQHKDVNRSPAYEEIPSKKSSSIQLHHNDAYELPHISQ